MSRQGIYHETSMPLHNILVSQVCHLPMTYTSYYDVVHTISSVHGSTVCQCEVANRIKIILMFR